MVSMWYDYLMFLINHCKLSYLLGPQGMTMVTDHGWNIKGMMDRKCTHTVTSILLSITYITFIKLRHQNHPQISHIYTNIAVFLLNRQRMSSVGDQYPRKYE